MEMYLKVKPNQRFDKVEKLDEGWQIRLKAPATDGKANEHLLEVLAEILEIPKSKIQLKKGHTSRIKCIEIEADAAFIQKKLESSINKTL